MGGIVAERLYKILPAVMPLSAKYRLTEGLWRHVGPSSKKTLRIGLDAPLEDVLGAVRAHMDDVVMNYRIEAGLAKRFEWLAHGDVHVKQDLLNHLQQMEKTLVVEAARAQMPVMLAHLRSTQGDYTQRLAQILRVGRHELELRLDRHSRGVAVLEPNAIRASGSNENVWLRWVLIGVGLLLLFAWAKGIK
jgi:hypothetical protein